MEPVDILIYLIPHLTNNGLITLNNQTPYIKKIRTLNDNPFK